MTQPVPHYNAPPADPDEGHLKALAIAHYVWGGLAMLLSCLFLFHVGFGVAMATNPDAFASNGQEPPPPFLGYMMAAMGGCGIVVGWTVGVLNIVSGRSIAARRRRMLSLVMAGVNCLSFPIGTALGVLTFIVLLRESVKAKYAAAAAQRPPGAAPPCTG